MDWAAVFNMDMVSSASDVLAAALSEICLAFSALSAISLMVAFISSAADATIVALAEDSSMAAATEERFEFISSAATETFSAISEVLFAFPVISVATVTSSVEELSIFLESPDNCWIIF